MIRKSDSFIKDKPCSPKLVPREDPTKGRELKHSLPARPRVTLCQCLMLRNTTTFDYLWHF